MKNYEEEFFNCLKGKMNPTERKLFEDKLHNSDSLRKSFEDYKTLTKMVEETKNIKLNPHYTQSIIADFRSKQTVKKYNQIFPMLKYALSFVIVTVLSFYFVNDFIKKDVNDIPSTLAELSTEEMNYVSSNLEVTNTIEYSLDEISIAKIDSLYSQQLAENIETSNEIETTEIILNGHELTDVEDYLSDDDIEKIYTQLIDKEIL
jgi:C4-dicarboxylate transporter